MNKRIETLVTGLSKGEFVQLRGPDALLYASPLIQHFTEALGFEIVVDPSTPPDLLDALGIWVPSVAEGAAIGGLLGLLLGTALGEPRAGVALGTLCGGLAGAARGSRNLRRGLRLVGRYDALGLPVVTIARR